MSKERNNKERNKKKIEKIEKTGRKIKARVKVKINDPGFDSHQIIQNPDELQREVMQMDVQMFMQHPGASEFVRERIEGEFPEGFLQTEEEKNARYVLIRVVQQDEKNIILRSPLTQAQFDEYHVQMRKSGARIEYHTSED